MRKLAPLFMTAAFLAAVSTQPAVAQDWHHDDIHHFHEHDYDHWRGGNWFHGVHEGRAGWWWIVDGSWYFYPAPVYPYPDPYTPPTVVVTQQAPAPVMAPTAPPAYVYYCANPAGYYPYISSCANWQQVASASVTPPPAPAPVAAPAPTGQRDADYRKLNNFAQRFSKINVNNPAAPAELKKLHKQVADFHEALFERSYDAAEIRKDADDLEHRIAAEREALLKHEPIPAPGMPPVSPPPPQQ